MTFLYDTPNKPTVTNWNLLYRFKTLLISAGWVGKASGDGLSAFSSSSDILTSGNSGANGFGNSLAWIRLQSPDTQREFVFQAGERIKYSRAAKFTGGSPSATVLPTATDEQFLIGTTGAPASWFNTNNTYRWVAGADNAAPYGFYSMAWPFDTTIASSKCAVIIFDPLVTGSYHASDADPYVLVCGAPGTNRAQTAGLGASSFAWYAAGLTGATWQAVQPQLYYNTNASVSMIPSGGSTDPWRGKRISMPLVWGRYAIAATPPTGEKGVSKLIKWNSIAMSGGQGVGLNSARDRICFDDINLPWGGQLIDL